MRRVVNGHPIVRVRYAERGQNPRIRPDDATNLNAGYAYVWSDKTTPPIGSYGTDSQRNILYVIGYGTDYKGSLKKVTKKLPGSALADASKEDVARLDAARRVLQGKNVRGVPPVTGVTSAAQADEWGKWWWRTYRFAEQNGAPDTAQIKAVAKYWFSVRDAAPVQMPTQQAPKQQPSIWDSIKRYVRGR